ncbi:DNA replication/repair protein RecF [Arcanobacterium pinnipediorum]|uniref:DNA replication and repair protein RecF n=1 Tax=Arcanobacterium pinnipediorum TaxID=1503041 RepID=A0ABY5AHU6_9ACTO|nr:DNA replication/repair protein RecF [Arcanobacterium pinnipediorum]USR79422.1 DNA replication/repair protein RecF [Arcanobacterium pinnipediorum]
MYISDLALNDFRSYREVIVSCQPGITTFIGENGQGKTNLVEAIGYLATFSSHRVNADASLVRQGASAAVVRAKVMHGQSPTTVEIEILAGKANRARINRGNAKPADLLGIVRTVVFAPEDLDLIKGDPAVRRHFLDEVMIQLRPRMAQIKTDYAKVGKQRAALLKTMWKTRRRGAATDDATIDIFDAQLARLGAQIIAERARIIAALRPYVEQYYREVSGGKGLARIDYAASVDQRTGWELPTPAQLHSDDSGKLLQEITAHEAALQEIPATEERMRAALRQWREQEIERGVNLVGPHRDDLAISLGTLPAKGFASHGESWSYALALRLASWRVLRDDVSGNWADDGEPILILDDVFAELDARRRQRLADIVRQGTQVFVTAAVGDDLPVELDGQKFFVHEGQVTPADDAGDASVIPARSGGSI